MSRGWSAWLIAALALVAVVIGLYMTGGPDLARKERRDNERMQELLAVGTWVDCVAGELGSLPPTLQKSQQCDWMPRIDDPYTGAPYRYEVLAPNRYRICANFDLPPPPREDRWARDAQGCITRDFIPRLGPKTPMPTPSVP